MWSGTIKYDLGPNLYALGSGLVLGPYAGVAVNIGALGRSLLQAEHHFLKIAQQKAGPTIAGVLSFRPHQPLCCFLLQRLNVFVIAIALNPASIQSSHMPEIND